MRPRFLIVLSVAVLVVFGLLFWPRPAKQPVASSPVQETQLPVQPANKQEDNKPVITATSGNNLTNPVLVDKTVVVSNQTTDTRELRMKQMTEELNVPVRFYGMVIDQNSNAISGVRVKLGVRHSVYAIPNSLEAAKYAALSTEELQKILNPTTEVISDSNGRFQWTDSNVAGDIVGVGSITKDGYEAEPGQYSCRAGDGNYDNPVVFKMWSTNVHEQLITGEKSFEIQPDGKPHVIDLTTGTMAETGDGDLKVWIRYTNQVSQGQLYDWSAGIEVINGGLLEEPHGTVMYVAPTDGYIPSFGLQQQIKGGQSGEIGDRSFYLMLKNGQEYGKMNINLYAPYGYLHPGLIRLSYAINPSGSRILR
jgi:hypothetical protein